MPAPESQENAHPRDRVSPLTTNGEPLTGSLDLARTRAAEIWSDVLGRPPAADDANFFDEGGDSLLAFDLLERIEDQLAVEIHFKQFWSHATFGELCAIVANLLTAGPAHR